MILHEERRLRLFPPVLDLKLTRRSIMFAVPAIFDCIILRGRSVVRACAWACVAFLTIGCGTTVTRSGTEQLLVSDAVDRSVARLDFSVLRDRTVYFDTQYIAQVKSVGFVNSQYIVSALRERLVGAGCQLQETKDAADYVVEARVGALGSDMHEVTYGVPASNTLNAAASLISSTPSLPTVPEIAFAKKNDQSAAAKLAVFAYHRETRRPIWQSGMAEARSSARDLWVLGAGPFQRGSIYDGTQFAGKEIQLAPNAKTTGHVALKQISQSNAVVPQRIFNSPEMLETEIRLAAEKAAAEKAEQERLAAEEAKAKAEAKLASEKKTAKPKRDKPVAQKPQPDKSTASAVTAQVNQPTG